MKSAKDIEQSIKKLAVESSNRIHDRILEKLLRKLDKSKKQTTFKQANIWRIIMKSRISITAAAAIALAFGLFYIFTNGTKSAYAIEQTIKAYEGLRYVHIKDFKEGQSESQEFWVELDEQEQVKRFRASLPTWAVGFNIKEPTVMVWNEGKLQIWRKNDNVIMTEQEDSPALALELQIIFKECDPRSVVKELHQLEAEGKVEIKISEPALKSEPIVITAKPLSQSNGLDQMVLFVDQNTKLVTRVVASGQENGYQRSREFLDYNVAIDERVFLLEPTPDITKTFMKNINAKLASLDINKSMLADVIAVLGEPWTYRFQGKNLEKDNLPEAYTINYPGGFMVSIYKNHVMQWGLQQIPGDETPGYIFSDSILIGTSLDDVFEKLGSPTKVVNGFGGEDNKIMYEDNTGYANMNINERKGFCFFQYDNNGEKIKLYLDDNILYKSTGKNKGTCLYGTVSNGKRIRFLFMDDKVIAIYEYKTESIKTTK